MPTQAMMHANLKHRQASRPGRTRGGFTILDLLIVIATIVVLFAVLLPLLTPRRHPQRGRTLKDQAQIRSIMQSLVLFADGNKGLYPLPSLLDGAHTTVAADPATPGGEHKDVTAHIISKLIYDGYFSVENCISPSEVNTAIEQDNDYEFERPPAAVDPFLALWDPAFAADFSAGTSNFSYAHMMPSGERLKLWTNTFSATEAAVGNRGPEITGLDASGHPIAKNPTSNTYLIHGSTTSWAGLVGFNDSHVSFFNEMNPDLLLYTTTSGTGARDTLFYDEPDDVNQTNAYLSIFRKAGAAPTDFEPIWD